MGEHVGVPPIPLVRPVIVIGSRSNARIHLSSSTVSKAHCILIRSGNGYYVRDLLSRSHTYVNDRAVHESDLEDGDQLRVGRFIFQYNSGPLKGGSTQLHQPPAARLDVTGSPISLPIEQRVLLIGRRPGSDVPLVEDNVSTSHAVIFEMDGLHFVRDLGSRNGTFVNGVQVHQHQLRPGDVIRIGDTDIGYRLDVADAIGLSDASGGSDAGTIPINDTHEIAEAELKQLATETAPPEATGSRPPLAPTASSRAAIEPPASTEIADGAPPLSVAHEKSSVETRPAETLASSADANVAMPSSRRGWRGTGSDAAQQPPEAPGSEANDEMLRFSEPTSPRRTAKPIEPVVHSIEPVDVPPIEFDTWQDEKLLDLAGESTGESSTSSVAPPQELEVDLSRVSMQPPAELDDATLAPEPAGTEDSTKRRRAGRRKKSDATAAAKSEKPADPEHGPIVGQPPAEPEHQRVTATRVASASAPAQPTTDASKTLVSPPIAPVPLTGAPVRESKSVEFTAPKFTSDEQSMSADSDSSASTSDAPKFGFTDNARSQEFSIDPAALQTTPTVASGSNFELRSPMVANEPLSIEGSATESDIEIEAPFQSASPRGDAGDDAESIEPHEADAPDSRVLGEAEIDLTDAALTEAATEELSDSGFARDMSEFTSTSTGDLVEPPAPADHQSAPPAAPSHTPTGAAHDVSSPGMASTLASQTNSVVSYGVNLDGHLGGMPVSLPETPVVNEKAFGAVSIDISKTPPAPAAESSGAEIDLSVPDSESDADSLADAPFVSDGADTPNPVQQEIREVSSILDEMIQGAPESLRGGASSIDETARHAPVDPFSMGAPAQSPITESRSQSVPPTPRRHGGRKGDVPAVESSSAAIRPDESIPPFSPDAPVNLAHVTDMLIGASVTSGTDVFATMSAPAGSDEAVMTPMDMVGTEPAPRKATRPTPRKPSVQPAIPLPQPQGASATAEAEAPASDRRPVRRPFADVRVAQELSRTIEQEEARLAELRRRRLRRVPVLLVTMLALLGAMWYAVWNFVPVYARVEATFTFTNFESLSQRERNEFQEARLAEIRGDFTRRTAARLLAERSDNSTSPGFLADQGAFQGSLLVAWLDTKPGTLLLRVNSSREEADAARMRAVLSAIYEGSATLANNAAEARAAKARLESAISEGRRRLEEVQAEAERARTIGQSGPSPAALAQLESDVKELERQWNSAVLAVKNLEAEVKRLEILLPPAPGDGKNPSTQPADAELATMLADLGKLNEQLAGARSAKSTEAQEAQRVLEGALTQFEQKLAQAREMMKDNPELTRYVQAATSFQESTRTLIDDMLRRQRQRVEQLNDLRTRLAEMSQSRRREMWQSDKELVRLTDELEMSRRQLNAARGAGLEREAADLKTQVDLLENLIKARQELLPQDPMYTEAITRLEGIIIQTQRDMDDDRQRTDGMLQNLAQMLKQSQPAVEKLPEEQKQLAEQLEKRLADISEARRQYNATVKLTAADSDESIKALQQSIATLQGSIDVRQRKLAEESSRRLTADQEQQRQADLLAKKKELETAMQTEREFQDRYFARSRELREANEQIARRGEATERLDSLLDEQYKIQTQLQAHVNQTEMRERDVRRAVEPQVPTDRDVQRLEGEDRRVMYGMIGSGAILVAFSLFIFLTVHGAMQDAPLTHLPVISSETPDGDSGGSMELTERPTDAADDPRVANRSVTSGNPDAIAAGDDEEENTPATI